MDFEGVHQIATGLPRRCSEPPPKRGDVRWICLLGLTRIEP